uniref:Blue-sensitive retinal pigment n=1 Tax=Geotria australis TaxID=71168 RepID=Q6UN31_9VERT|nr:blue-sensitive retinal pigment [Geotria australis]
MYQGKSTQVDDLPEDFYIPIALNVKNMSELSPFLVPQVHLGDSFIFYGMSAFMLFLVLAGFPLNFLTVFVTIKYKKLRSHLNYILVNLAIANLIVVCCGSTLAFYSFMHKYFILGPLFCKMEGFTATLGGMLSLWSLAVLAFERCLVICKPFGNIAFRGTHALIRCGFAWAAAIAASTPPLFGWSRYIPEGLQCSCGPDWYTTNNKYNNESYVMFLFIFCFGTPFTIIIVSYSKLILTLRAAAAQQQESASTQKAEKEVSRMVVIMVGGFLVCWLPYASLALWIVFNRGSPFDLRLATIPSVFSKASTVYNPVIYIFLNKQFRSCMMKTIFCGKNPLGDDEDATSTTTQVSSVSTSQVAPA